MEAKFSLIRLTLQFIISWPALILNILFGNLPSFNKTNIEQCIWYDNILSQVSMKGKKFKILNPICLGS